MLHYFTADYTRWTYFHFFLLLFLFTLLAFIFKKPLMHGCCKVAFCYKHLVQFNMGLCMNVFWSSDTLTGDLFAKSFWTGEKWVKPIGLQNAPPWSPVYFHVVVYKLKSHVSRVINTHTHQLCHQKLTSGSHTTLEVGALATSRNRVKMFHLCNSIIHRGHYLLNGFIVRESDGWMVWWKK